MNDAPAPDNAADVKRQFGPVANDYLTSEIHAKGESLDWMVKMAQPLATWRALDVACGAGHTAVRFAPRTAVVVATDITPEMLAVARANALQNGLTNVEFVEAPADRLPFAAGSFDLATCRLAAHHFADTPAAFAEIHRVLAPRGTFLLADNFTLPDAESAEFHNAFERLRDPSHVRLVSLIELEQMLEAAGFEVLEFAEISKAVDLESWAQRQRCSDETKRRLGEMLARMPKTIEMLLAPKPVEGDWQFTIWEAVFHCRRR